MNQPKTKELQARLMLCRRSSSGSVVAGFQLNDRRQSRI